MFSGVCHVELEGEFIEVQVRCPIIKDWYGCSEKGKPVDMPDTDRLEIVDYDSEVMQSLIESEVINKLDKIRWKLCA